MTDEKTPVGSKSLMPVAQALALVTADAHVLPAETVGVERATGRVLAAALHARRSQPSADMSAMDGYAFGYPPSSALATSFTVVGEAAAGRPFAGTVTSVGCVRIFTGAVLPGGTDTVVIQENVTRAGDSIHLTAPVARGRNVRTAGFDFQVGKLLLPQGRRLSGRDVMLAAAADHAALPVVRRPRVGIIQTGDELVRPGAGTGAPSEVVVSNVYGIAALAEEAGAEVLDLGLVADTMDDTRAALRRAFDLGLDVLVSSGGASVGEHDLMAPALRAEGIDLSVHKIALRPGKPLMFGVREGQRVLGLPGNPVSAYVCAILFLLPLLRALQGEHGPWLRASPARLAVAVPENDRRMDFIRACTEQGEDGIGVVTPLPIQDSGMLTALAQADCLLIREPFAPAAEAGAPCKVIPLKG
ncbi:molybdopterin molybdotransferase MoeA [Azorhizobium sp. AG788]|uniref:molybdopterin molybdotransferase MoeA n=1 Tax=Azorhizobium sp. AG788 TaxID=2183897 RepID=UPI003139C4E6